MTQTSNLSLPLLAAGQAQKHVTHNEALALLDALIHLSVKESGRNAPPAMPSQGDRYLVGSSASGAFAGQAGKLALFDAGNWAFLTPRTGWRTYDEAAGVLLIFNGTAWAAQSGMSLDNLDHLGIGTSADATNRLSVKAPGVLLTGVEAASGGSGDLRLTLNKETASDVVSLLMQSGYSGRLEIGLIGSEDTVLRVSADGASWNDALTIERSTGQVSFPRGAQRVQVDAFTASGSWSKPGWAKRVTAILVGGGGGGGGGRRGASATDRRGGGGGGAGGIAREEWLASELPSSLTIDIGNGGTGGSGASTNDANGGNGGAGAETVLRDGNTTLLVASGGNGGAGGTSTTTNGGAGGAGSMSLANAGGAGGAPNGSAGNSTSFGGGPGGGGGGGGLSTADATGSGALGGFGYSAGGASRRAAQGSGAGAGLNGGAGADRAWARGCGAGGGGGGSGNATATTPGGQGGTGGAPGGGGGGGGACANGANAGTGGAGGRGEAWVISVG